MIAKQHRRRCRYGIWLITRRNDTMQVIASAPQPAGYLTIIERNAVPRRLDCACVTRDNRSLQSKRANWPLAILVASGWLLIVAALAVFFTPEDAEQVRTGYAKIAMMTAVMSTIGWLSVRPETR
jgi:hypothetical protein